MNDEGEEILICPYEKSHAIRRNRMQFHLAKCAKQHPCSERATCPFNSTHVVPKLELELHQRLCSSRHLIDNVTHVVEAHKKPLKIVEVNKPVIPKPDEDWDDEDDSVPRVSVLDLVKNLSKEKPVIRTICVAPRSERIAHRNEERLRYQRVIDGVPLDVPDPKPAKAVKDLQRMVLPPPAEVRLPPPAEVRLPPPAEVRLPHDAVLKSSAMKPAIPKSPTPKSPTSPVNDVMSSVAQLSLGQYSELGTSGASAGPARSTSGVPPGFEVKPSLAWGRTPDTNTAYGVDPAEGTCSAWPGSSRREATAYGVAPSLETTAWQCAAPSWRIPSPPQDDTAPLDFSEAAYPPLRGGLGRGRFQRAAR